MRRRHFFASLAAAGAPLPAIPALRQVSGQGRLRIADVQVFRVQGPRETVADVHRQHQAQPLHIYEEHRPKPYREPAEGRRTTVTASAYYLKISTNEGLEGLYGPLGREAVLVVDQQLKNFLRGKDALAGELLWDQTHRSNRHSRRGHYVMAISAVDNTLWDLRGRYFNLPVYRLLGGPTRLSVRAYGSCLGFSVEPEAVRSRSVALKKEGYRHQEWFLAYGPGDGADGLAHNVALVRNLRDALGDEVEIMFDAFMGWDLNYALAWAKQVEQYRPRWIEEAFQPDKIESFAQLRRKTSVPVASGEHFYGRWETHDYLRAGALDVVQADPEWCGGVSELVKICTLASLFDVHVVPHGHSLHAALHVVASQPPITCPMVEWLINKMSEAYYFFEKHPPRVVNGRIELPERPGFGIELDPAKIERYTPPEWS